jgi:hypothetical protein
MVEMERKMNECFWYLLKPERVNCSVPRKRRKKRAIDFRAVISTKVRDGGLWACTETPVPCFRNQKTAPNPWYQ